MLLFVPEKKVIEERLWDIIKAVKNIRSLCLFFFLIRLQFFSLSLKHLKLPLFLTIDFSYLFKSDIQKSFPTHDFIISFYSLTSSLKNVYHLTSDHSAFTQGAFTMHVLPLCPYILSLN